MNQSPNKPKLSDVARQTNTDKAKRFSSTMIPTPPLPKEPTPRVEESVETAPVMAETPVIQEAKSEPEKVTPVATPPPVATKPTRTRRSGSLSIDEVISGEPPKGEVYPRQVRISESHHKLLRKLSFMHEKTMNHVLYNLLDLLEQADQRDQQKGD